MFGRRKVAALVAEFLGTGVLTLVVLSVQRSTIGVPYFVALAAGLVMAMALSVFGGVSGAQLNPAITIALWAARKVATIRAILYVIVQVLGAWTAYGVYTYFVNNTLQKIGGTFTLRVMVAEAIGAFVLGLGWAAVSYRNNQTDGSRAATVGVSYALAVIVASAAGIGLVNPAVALGVRAWDVFGSMGWGTYVLGPIVGAVLAVTLYGLLFARSNDDAEEAVVVEEVVIAETVEEPTVAAATPKRASTRKTTTTRKTSTRAKASGTSTRARSTRSRS